MRRPALPRTWLPALLFFGCSSTPPPAEPPAAKTAAPIATAAPAPAPTVTAVASAEPAPPPPAPEPPSKWAACEKAPVGMVCIPGGPAVIGSNDHEAREKPEHTVEVSTFYLDRYEVTNAEYEACEKAGCQRMKAITTLGNEGSQRFHASLGWKVEEVDDYAGRGRKRVVFTKHLGS